MYMSPTRQCYLPITFQHLIMDMFEEVSGAHTKFADDGTLWHTGKDVLCKRRCLKM